MAETPNLGLKKHEANDFIDFETHFNPNWDKIDTELAQNESELTIVKTKRVSVESFPRLGGETDDTARIQRAYATLNAGDTFVIPKDYTITNLAFDKDHIFFEWTGWLTQLATATGIAVTLGKSTPSFSVEGLLKVKKATRDWTQDNTGVKLLNMNETIISVDIRDFTNNLVIEGNNNGCSYNEITVKRIVNGKKNISFSEVGTGWANENKFYSGRIYWNSGILDTDRYHVYIPSTTMNNNVFFSPSFESADGGTMIYCNGQYNHFYSPRLEGAGTIKIVFGVNSLYNQVLYPYSHTDVISDANYIDNGTRNHILSRDDLQFNQSIVRASAFKAKGNAKQNSAWGNGASFEGQSTVTNTDLVYRGLNSGGTETFSVDGNGATKVFDISFVNGQRIASNGDFDGAFGVSDAYISKGFKIASIKSTAGAPTSNSPKTGVAVLNTVDSKIYFHMGEGVWKGINLT